MRGAAARLLLIFSLLWLAGCSVVQLAYDHAGTWIRWRADHYLDMRGQQQADIVGHIAEFMSWHRREALPRYAKYLDEAAQRLGNGLSREDLVWGYDSARGQLAHDLQIAAARLAEVLDTLEPDQIANLERRFAEDNRKYSKEFLSGTPEKRREKRTRRNVERLEEWFGDLTDVQLEQVRRHSEEQPLIDERRDRERKRMQAGLLTIVRARQARETLGAWAAQLLPGAGEPKYAAAAKPYLDSYMDLLLDIDRMATPRQRQHAVSRLRGYANDLALLSLARESSQAAR